MLLLYFVIGVTILGLILFCLKGFSEADPVVVKKIFLFAGTILTVALLVRFGMPLFAALIALVPFIRKILGVVLTLRRLREILSPDKSKKARSVHPMSKEEARSILEVGEDATKAEIKEAYQRLMKKNHPDTGGSKYIASQLNQAKDVLLK